MACSCVACKRVACDCVTAWLCDCVTCSCVVSRGRGHQISTTFKPSTERLVSIL